MKCSYPQLGGKIALEIAFNMAQGTGVHLTPEESQHLAECKECNCMLPLWFRKGAAARETGKAYNIVNLAETGDRRILKRSTQYGTALFKSHEDDTSKGLLVEISATGDISDGHEVTLDEFNRLE